MMWSSFSFEENGMLTDVFWCDDCKTWHRMYYDMDWEVCTTTWIGKPENG